MPPRLLAMAIVLATLCGCRDSAPTPSAGGEEKVQVLEGVTIELRYQEFDPVRASDIYAMLVQKGMKGKAVGQGIGVYGPKLIYYQTGSDEAAAWLRSNVSEFADFVLRPGDYHWKEPTVCVNMW